MDNIIPMSDARLKEFLNKHNATRFADECCLKAFELGCKSGVEYATEQVLVPRLKELNKIINELNELLIAQQNE